MMHLTVRSYYVTVGTDDVMLVLHHDWVEQTTLPNKLMAVTHEEETCTGNLYI